MWPKEPNSKSSKSINHDETTKQNAKREQKTEEGNKRGQRASNDDERRTMNVARE